jgi:hypothetical protein
MSTNQLILINHIESKKFLMLNKLKEEVTGFIQYREELAPTRSPKVISTIVALGSESWLITTTGVGMVSLSLGLAPVCHPIPQIQKPKEIREVSYLICKTPYHIDQKLFTSRAVTDDACGVIAVTEDNHLTKTHRNLTKIIATMPCPSVSRCWTTHMLSRMISLCHHLF